MSNTTSDIKGSHTPVHGLVYSVLPLQHGIRVLQVTTERCGNLATRLRVGPLCSMMQPSPLLDWPQRITDEPTMQVHSVPWQLTSHPGWALPCIWVVKPFKRVLCVTTHPQILTLELQAPMGTCSRQYGIKKLRQQKCNHQSSPKHRIVCLIHVLKAMESWVGPGNKAIDLMHVMN